MWPVRPDAVHEAPGCLWLPSPAQQIPWGHKGACRPGAAAPVLTPICSSSRAPAALPSRPPALSKSSESFYFLTRLCLQRGYNSSCSLLPCLTALSLPPARSCQEPPGTSSGFLCFWMAAEGAHCRGVHGRLKAGRGGSPEQSGQRLLGGGGSNLEHPGSGALPHFLLASLPLSLLPGTRLERLHCSSATSTAGLLCGALPGTGDRGLQVLRLDLPCHFLCSATFLLPGWPPLFSLITF